jgi:alanine dehydrogenase
VIETFVTAEECRRVLTPDRVLKAIEDCLRMEGAGDVTWPTPRNLNINGDRSGNDLHVKACVLEPLGVTGVRVVAHPLLESSGTSTRVVLLVDTTTNLPLALVDDSWTYAQRTVANLLLIAHHVRPPRIEKVAIIGAGTLADASLPYVRALFGDVSIAIASRREDTREALATKARETWGLDAHAATPETATRGAGIVLTATGADRPVIEDEWVSDGTVVACVETAECGAAFFSDAAARFVDSREQLRSELIAYYGADAPEKIDATMAELLCGVHPGRRTAEERILLISQGLVSQDIALAYAAFRSIGDGAHDPQNVNDGYNNGR